MQQGLKKETEKSSVLRTDNTILQDEIRELKKQLKPIDPNKALQVSCAGLLCCVTVLPYFLNVLPGCVICLCCLTVLPDCAA